MENNENKGISMETWEAHRKAAKEEFEAKPWYARYPILIKDFVWYQVIRTRD